MIDSRRPDLRLTAFVVALTLWTAGVAVAQDRGTQADQDACTPDVFRLCNDFIPDEQQIVACLRSKYTQLSPACGKVMAPASSRSRRQRQTPD